MHENHMNIGTRAKESLKGGFNALVDPAFPATKARCRRCFCNRCEWHKMFALRPCSELRKVEEVTWVANGGSTEALNTGVGATLDTLACATAHTTSGPQKA